MATPSESHQLHCAAGQECHRHNSSSAIYMDPASQDCRLSSLSFLSLQARQRSPSLSYWRVHAHSTTILITQYHQFGSLTRSQPFQLSLVSSIALLRLFQKFIPLIGFPRSNKVALQLPIPTVIRTEFHAPLCPSSLQQQQSLRMRLRRFALLRAPLLRKCRRNTDV